MLCYVATGFGETDINVVNADVDLYQSFYPDMCDGFFFDEGPGTAMYAYKCEPSFAYFFLILQVKYGSSEPFHGRGGAFGPNIFTQA